MPNSFVSFEPKLVVQGVGAGLGSPIRLKTAPRAPIRSLYKFAAPDQFCTVRAAPVQTQSGRRHVRGLELNRIAAYRIAMKKLIIRIAIVAIVLLVVAVIAAALCLDSIVKKGVETVGPQITKTEMKLAGVSLSVLSGSGELKGFTLGNPEGFKAPSAMTVSHVKIGVAPMSVLSDKVHVKQVHVIEPQITFEATGLNIRANNLSKILENVQAVAGGDAAAKPAPAESSGAS